MMNLSSWIAGRFLRSPHTGRFAPLLKVTALLSVAMGICALTVVMGVMRGFREELSTRLTALNAPVTLTRTDEGALLDADQVRALFPNGALRDVSPFVEGEVIVQSNVARDPIAMGGRVRGIDRSSLERIAGLGLVLPESVDASDPLAPRAGEEIPGAIIGREMAGELAVHPDFEDRLMLTAPLAEVGPTGELLPSSRPFVLNGLFRTGLYEYDGKMILTTLEDARRLLGQQAREGWHVWLNTTTAAPEMVAAVTPKLPAGWEAEGIHQQNRKLFAALALERTAMGAILFLVVLIASCAIIGVILLVGAAKRKDIALLEAIGMTRRGIQRIFLVQAALIGAVGSFIGLAAGMGIIGALILWPVRLPDSYYLDFLPVEVNPVAALLFALAGIAIALVASIVPARQTTRLDPAEVLRYE